MISATEKARAAIKETRPYWQKAQGEFLQRFGEGRWTEMRENLTEISRILTSQD